MTMTIKEVFAKHGKNLTVDATLVRRLNNFGNGWINRSESHVAWVGGNLLGVDPIKFKTTDRQSWFEDILQMDEQALEDDLHSSPEVDPDFQVSSDAFNQSCIYLAYRIATSSLPDHTKHAALVDTFLIMQYKLMSSIMSHYFKHPADRPTAQATYESLNKKFMIKALGSWGAVLHARAEDIIAAHSIHYQTYTKYNDGKRVVYMINDIQGRLREQIKALTNEFYKVRESGSRYQLVSATIERDGLTVIKDKVGTYQTYTRYLKGLLSDRPSFIRPELAKIVCDLQHTMPPKAFDDALGWISANATNKDVLMLVDEALNHAYDYIMHTREFQTGNVNIGLLLTRLRALYMASRKVNPILIRCTDIADEIVAREVRSQNPSLRASVRTGVLLCVVLRGFAYTYYK